MHRREEVQRFHVDHDISCETQRPESVPPNSAGHPEFAVFLLSFFQPECSRSLFNSTRAPAIDRNLESDCVIMSHQRWLKKKSRSVTRPRTGCFFCCVPLTFVCLVPVLFFFVPWRFFVLAPASISFVLSRRSETHCAPLFARESTVKRTRRPAPNPSEKIQNDRTKAARANFFFDNHKGQKMWRRCGRQTEPSILFTLSADEGSSHARETPMHSPNNRKMMR